MGFRRPIDTIKEPYKRDIILQKRRIISSILLSAATPYVYHASFILFICNTHPFVRVT